MPSPLRNAKHEAFCRFYVEGHPTTNGAPTSWREKPRHNATRSYEAAGYTARGNVAATHGARLLKRPDVRARIKELEQANRGPGQPTPAPPQPPEGTRNE